VEKQLPLVSSTTTWKGIGGVNVQLHLLFSSLYCGELSALHSGIFVPMEICHGIGCCTDCRSGQDIVAMRKSLSLLGIKAGPPPVASYCG